MNEEVIDQRLKERYKDDLEGGESNSDCLLYVIEEQLEALLEILKSDDEEEILDLVEAIKGAAYQKFHEDNYDSVSRTIVSEGHGE